MSEPKPFFFDPSEVNPRRVAQRGSASLPYNCSKCPVGARCLSPRMEPYGEGRLRILLLGESPGRQEDKVGRQFVGPSGVYLAAQLSYFGISMERDCVRQNVVQCYVPQNEKDKLNRAGACCEFRLNEQLDRIRPQVILAFGGFAVRSLLKPPGDVESLKFRGRVIPFRERNCWVGCFLHPSYILRQRSRARMNDPSVDMNDPMDRLFGDDLGYALSYLGKPLTDVPMLVQNDYEYCTGDRARQVLSEMSRSVEPVILDFETTGLDTLQPDFRLLMIGLCCLGKRYVLPYSDDLKPDLAAFLVSKAPKVIQYWTYEELVSRRVCGVSVGNVVHDTMVCEHVLDERRKCTSLEFQTFVHYGARYKRIVSFGDGLRLGDDLPGYNSLDTGYTERRYQDQLIGLAETPGYIEAYDFFHRVIPVFANLTAEGVYLDRPFLTRFGKVYGKKCGRIKERLLSHPAVLGFTKKGKSFDPDSGDHCRDLFYKTMGLPVGERTTAKGGQVPVDEKALSAMLLNPTLQDRKSELSFIQSLLDYRELVKVLGTYVEPFLATSGIDGCVHPSFMLNTVETYRSSSLDPNLQNIPARSRIGKLFRRALIPKPWADALLEVDYSGAEVRVLAMYSRDPKLTKWLNEGYDFHKEFAAKLYSIPIEQVTSGQRYIAKNQFTFPEFYGSYYRSIAEKNPQWTEARVREVEDELWDTFPVIKEWQARQIESYRRRGYVDTFLGFRRHAPLSQNQIINTPIQGTASHLLFDGMCRISEGIQRLGLKTRMFVQVHDSVLFYLVAEEANEVSSLVRVGLEQKRFDWEGDVQMRVEAKMGINWGEMEGIEL